jgi:hypothetical protein
LNQEEEYKTRHTIKGKKCFITLGKNGHNCIVTIKQSGQKELSLEDKVTT